MSRKIITAVCAAVLAAALAGCGGAETATAAKTVTVTATPTPSSTSQAATQSPSAPKTEKQRTGKTLEFGTPVKSTETGSVLTVGKPQAFSPSSTADLGPKTAAVTSWVKMKVTYTNHNGDAYETAYTQFTATNGDTAAPQIFDYDQQIGDDDVSVLPGKTHVSWVAFGIEKGTEFTLTVSDGQGPFVYYQQRN